MAVLASGKQVTGTHPVGFNGSKSDAGIYLYQLETLAAIGKMKTLTGNIVLVK